MIFKKVDRYVSTAFLLRALGCAMLIVLLYVSFDVLKRQDDIQDAEAAIGAGTLVAYYSQVVPLFVLELVPGVVLVAAGMVMVGMARSGELMALKACGASVHRVVAPIFFWTLLLCAAVFLAREWLAPQMMQRERFLSHVMDGDVQRELWLDDSEFSRKFFLREYGFAQGTARYVCVVETRPDSTMAARILADSAEWGAGSVRLRTAEVQEFQEGTGWLARSEVLPELTLPTGISRADLLQASEEGQERPPVAQTLSDLRDGARQYPNVPSFRVAFHSRLASAVSPLILLMIGVPCLVGFERSVNSRFLGAILSIALAAGLYTLTFVFSSMGNTGSINTALAGWLPTILGGSLGLWLFESMLT